MTKFFHYFCALSTNKNKFGSIPEGHISITILYGRLIDVHIDLYPKSQIKKPYALFTLVQGIPHTKRAELTPPPKITPLYIENVSLLLFSI